MGKLAIFVFDFLIGVARVQGHIRRWRSYAQPCTQKCIQAFTQTFGFTTHSCWPCSKAMPNWQRQLPPRIYYPVHCDAKFHPPMRGRQSHLWIDDQTPTPAFQSLALQPGGHCAEYKCDISDLQSVVAIAQIHRWSNYCADHTWYAADLRFLNSGLIFFVFD